ncbi:DNA polymerase III subunit gamma/tau [Erythrobacter crassostreae]|uniref:DNA polymerase III subunit gamma/tau n=1 Tax=Erythrobacter crassostreae TaxID=2828328 RepID=A0A9X1JPP2_9SPHN|nr:DNA polymerase III subunit gamma/tau [Erythrobacter crassostrea]MBV7259642.1 DNA polymerase III subunit gamma/tau [Erythrobacter crassostrea]
MNDSDPDLPEGEEENTPTAAELEAAGQNSMFGDPAPDEKPAEASVEPAAVPAAAPAPEQTHNATETDKSQPYRVLARKYRPQTFSELIGQEPMVRTLANAIERDRLAHAFLMTGVRGVGKTSTARLIAKALNCVGPDGESGPTIAPCGQCEPCTAIAEGRHIDVIEMDAASHTGVDDVRDIIEQVRYAAVSARYKIYIIDEVHMLSRNAFNALLKTLEEPPAHVKFLFATTEVEKLPVTVLSRTQRFDLRRIPSDLLASHFGKVCGLEGVEAEEEALRIIAASAEGSVRDGLSILDQAIAHADLDEDSKVTAERVRDMLGLADKSAQRHLLNNLLEGDAKALLAAIDEQYSLGVEPLALMRALMDLVHKITVAQVSGAEPDAPSEEERSALGEFATKLGAGELHRLWQLMLKGHEEVRQAPDPLVSIQMALLRVLHASELPDPGKLARRIEQLANSAPAQTSTPSAGDTGTSAQAALPQSASLDWEALVDEVDRSGKMHVAELMRSRVRVIELGPDKLIYEQADNFPDDPGPEIRDALLQIKKRRWLVEKGTGDAQPTLREVEQEKANAARNRILSDPLVKATLEAFPDAELMEADGPNAKVARASGSKWN